MGKPITSRDITGMACFTFFGQSECVFWMAQGELSEVESRVRGFCKSCAARSSTRRVSLNAVSTRARVA